jgi:hypothetical protein
VGKAQKAAPTLPSPNNSTPSKFAASGVVYADMDRPAVSWDSVWAVYLELLRRFRLLEALPPAYHAEWQEAATLAREEHTANGDQFDLEPDLQELPEEIGSGGFQYMGGVNDGRGIGIISDLSLQKFGTNCVTRQRRRKTA